MKTVVIYDSAFGNTKKIAEAIAQHLNTISLPVEEATPEIIYQAETVIIGSPTQGGKATTKVQTFLHALSNDALKNKSIAAFDTRFAINEHGLGMKMLMKTIGFAAAKIATILKDKGGKELVYPEGFIVKEKSGPLFMGEINRAHDWAEHIKELAEAERVA